MPPHSAEPRYRRADPETTAAGPNVTDLYKIVVLRCNNHLLLASDSPNVDSGVLDSCPAIPILTPKDHVSRLHPRSWYVLTPPRVILLLRTMRKATASRFLDGIHDEACSAVS